MEPVVNAEPATDDVDEDVEALCSLPMSGCTKILTFKVTRAEKEEIERAAAEQGELVAPWVRGLCLRYLGRTLPINAETDDATKDWSSGRKEVITIKLPQAGYDILKWYAGQEPLAPMMRGLCLHAARGGDLKSGRVFTPPRRNGMIGANGALMLYPSKIWVWLRQCMETISKRRVRFRRVWMYRDYLKSPQWDQKRRRALRRSGWRCQVCNNASLLDVHHRTYERLGHERIADLTVLCRQCHLIFHKDARRKSSKRLHTKAPVTNAMCH